MASLSKYFSIVTRNRTCADFTHPNMTCWQSARELWFGALMGSVKFYFPGVFLPMLFKLEKWRDPVAWKELLKRYLKCILIGYFLTFGSINMFCISYHIFKGFHYPTFVFLPSALGCSFCMFLPDKMLHIDSIGLQAMLLGSLFKSSSNPVVSIVRKSRNLATISFMFVNAAIMFGLNAIGHNRFWFASLADRKVKITKDPVSECGHKENCVEHNLKVIKRSWGFGISLCSLKTIIPVCKSLIRGQPLTAARMYFRHLNLRAFLFLFTNPVLFNTLLCALQQHQHRWRGVNNSNIVTIAGFLAGFSYFFFPNYLIFGFGLITAIELLWQSYMASALEKPKSVVIFNKLPFKVLLYMLTVGWAFQMRVVYPHMTHKFIHTLMSHGTAGRMDLVTENFGGMMMGLQ